MRSVVVGMNYGSDTEQTVGYKTKSWIGPLNPRPEEKGA